MGAQRENGKKVLEYLNVQPSNQPKGPEEINSAIGMESDALDSALEYLRKIDAVITLLSGMYYISPIGKKFLEDYDKISETVTREEIDIINARLRQLSEELTPDKLSKKVGEVWARDMATRGYR